jgi:predicted DNA-binding transcriptional regulator AlpA
MSLSNAFPQNENNRIARLPEACRILGLSPSTIRNRIKLGGRWYDAKFPQPKRLGTGRRCAIGWLVHELLAYVEGQYRI